MCLVLQHAEYIWSWVSLFLLTVFLSRGYIPQFLNLVLIKAVDIDSHGSLNSFVKFVSQCFFPSKCGKLDMLCVKQEKFDFTGWNIATSRGWNIWVMCGGKQYRWILLALHSWMVFMSKFLFLKLLYHLSAGPVFALKQLGCWLFLVIHQANAFTVGMDNGWWLGGWWKPCILCRILNFFLLLQSTQSFYQISCLDIYCTLCQIYITSFS